MLQDIDNTIKATSGLPNANLLRFQEIDYLDNKARTYRNFNMNRNAFIILVMGYKTKRAMEYKLAYLARFDEMEAMLHGETKPYKQPSNQALGEQLQIFATLTQTMRLDKSSQFMLASDIAKSHNIPAGFLDYTEAGPKPVIKSLKDLLKEHGCKQSAIAVNRLLAQRGYLEQQTRQSTKTPDKIKKFWVLTDAGMKFGKNLIFNKNQKQTQPHYFVDSFVELMGLIGV